VLNRENADENIKQDVFYFGKYFILKHQFLLAYILALVIILFPAINIKINHFYTEIHQRKGKGRVQLTLGLYLSPAYSTMN
jgi:hypothetical protein